eukprot:scaffold1554_cov108-Isochrysis_galbana.AAC.1
MLLDNPAVEPLWRHTQQRLPQQSRRGSRAASHLARRRADVTKQNPFSFVMSFWVLLSHLSCTNPSCSFDTKASRTRTEMSPEEKASGRLPVFCASSSMECNRGAIKA